MKLLVDMNVSPRWIDFLEGAGFQAAHWSTTGAADATDHAIMAHARDNDFVVLSQDLEAGARVTVDPVRARLRVLPL